jgi:hypothetical protein
LGNNYFREEDLPILLPNQPLPKKGMNIKAACGESHLLLFFKGNVFAVFSNNISAKEVLISDHFFLMRFRDNMPLSDIDVITK